MQLAVLCFYVINRGMFCQGTPAEAKLPGFLLLGLFKRRIFC
jgi:hypothetical protein